MDFSKIPDDVYHQLLKCFAASGRGNRPKPPTGLPLTNRLLLQLRRLQEECGKASETVVSDFQI